MTRKRKALGKERSKTETTTLCKEKIRRNNNYMVPKFRSATSADKLLPDTVKYVPTQTT